MCAATHAHRSRLPGLLAVEGLTAKVRTRAEAYALDTGVLLPRTPEVI
jgi:hypothetical protein